MGYTSFAEFIPANVRGKWSARLSFISNGSLMLSAAIGVMVISTFSWRAMFLLGEIWMPAAWFLSGIYFLESPRCLAGKGRKAMAEPSLRNIE